MKLKLKLKALGAVVAFLLALVADAFLNRAGATRVRALPTPGTLLAVLMLLPLRQGAQLSAAAPLVSLEVAHHHLRWLFSVMENSLLFLNNFALPDNLLRFLQHEIGVHLQTFRQGHVEDSQD